MSQLSFDEKSRDLFADDLKKSVVAALMKYTE